MTHHIAVNPLERVNLIHGKAIGLVCSLGAMRQIARRNEIAAPRIVNQSVFQSILGIALLINPIRQQTKLRRRKRIRIHSLHPISARQMRSSLIETRRSGDDSIEIVREPLCQREPLPTALRTAVIVGLGRTHSVVSAREHLGEFSRDVQRAETVIQQLLLVQRKAGAWFNSSRMTRIRGGRHKARPQPMCPIGHSPRVVKSRPPTIAEHIEPAVPLGRQIHFNVEGRLNHYPYPAMLRNIG